MLNCFEYEIENNNNNNNNNNAIYSIFILGKKTNI